MDTKSNGTRLVLCGVYYYVWVNLLPKWKGYELRQTVLKFDNGLVSHKLVKVPNSELAQWDEEHDAVGNLRRRVGHDSADSA